MSRPIKKASSVTKRTKLETELYTDIKSVINNIPGITLYHKIADETDRGFYRKKPSDSIAMFRHMAVLIEYKVTSPDKMNKIQGLLARHQIEALATYYHANQCGLVIVNEFNIWQDTITLKKKGEDNIHIYFIEDILKSNYTAKFVCRNIQSEVTLTLYEALDWKYKQVALKWKQLLGTSDISNMIAKIEPAEYINILPKATFGV